MTPEEKAKAYDKALERANDILKGYNPKEDSKATINYIFPELKEEEDEKIRKVLIEGFKRYDDEFLFNGCLVKEILSWLEKQKDCIKLPNSVYTFNRDVIEFADKYSHTIWEKLMDKFKENENYSIGCNDVSDIVLNAIINTYNWLEKQVEQKEYTFKSLPRLLDMIEPTSRTKAYCRKLIDTLTKEGYNTDAKIVEEVLKGWNGENVPMAVMDEKQGEQNLNACLNYIPDESLRMWLTDTIHAKYDKIAWSEEDEKRFKSCLNILQPKTLLGNTETINTKWFKFLKQRYTWKPSDEQMLAFEQTYDWYNTHSAQNIALNSLYNDLKKLKGE